MSAKKAITIQDLQRLAEGEAPDLHSAIESLRSLADEEQYDDEGEVIRQVPEGAMSLDDLRVQLQAAARNHDKKARQEKAKEAWDRYLAQPDEHISPVVRIAELVVWAYENRAKPAARHALMTIIRDAPFVYGFWGGIKRVFKRAEADLDAEIWGAIAARVDAVVASGDNEDVSKGTLIYVRRRGWRFLKHLGKALPEIYPQFAVEVLRQYPQSTSFGGVWIAGHIFAHGSKSYSGTQFWGSPPKDMVKQRAYTDAWKRSADPLMLLLETCLADPPAKFAIAGLQKDFPDVLRKVTPAWLARLAYRPLESAHEFLIETLEASPEFHQGKLKGIGLHDAVLELLLSPSKKARTYAIEYARGHATDLALDRVTALLGSAEDSGYKETVTWAAAALTGRKPRDIGVVLLGRLLRYDTTHKFAKKALNEDLDRTEIPESFLIDMLFSEEESQSEWASEYLEKKYKPKELPLSFWIKICEDKRFEDTWTVDEIALEAISKFAVSELPADWFLKALSEDKTSDTVAGWLKKADALPDGVDLERIKGMIFNPAQRQAAFTILGSTKLVAPNEVGLPWLLALARRADPTLHEWAHRYLLEHMKPEHFSDAGKDKDAGIVRLFALATGAKEPEAVRAFAQTYLKCHHPKLSRDVPETKQFGIKPGVPREAYTKDRVWPALSSNHADVRRFGVTVARVELRKWHAQGSVYELAESSAKEVRNLAYDALMQAGEQHADKDFALTPEELDAAQIFSMTESRKRSSRDCAMELIRKHYKRIGGAERLGWLMQSADREVRLFAVRLLWEKHRPRGIPKTWKPAKGRIDDAGRFEDREALRALLRRLLFMIPPTRSAESLEGARSRKLPASIAKRHVIEIVRDFAVGDADFAQLVAPVLGEMTGSIAKGEWQTCLAALLTLRRAHGEKILEAQSG